ncbi:MAG TPA: helix-turn-helix domain-containing protein [Bryobacteraceae bacterium]|nr:helix-turn-helix domain-containing protein [Bryobacteraceae bacterium]
MEDIPLLVEHFVQRFADRLGKTIHTTPDEVMEALKAYRWPGNIRELQNVIERGVILTTDRELSRETTALLRSWARQADRLMPVKTLADAERAHILETLRRTNGVVGGRAGAAAQLGLARTTLIARMRRLGICIDTSGRIGRPYLVTSQSTDAARSEEGDESRTNSGVMEASVA